MSEPVASEWRPMASAPRDGTRILVAIRASEQGPAEVDVARFARIPKSMEDGWLAIDSDREAPFVYSEGDLAGWMPLPDALPRLRTRPSGPNEADGSAI